MARNSTVRVSCRVERQQQQCQITPLHGSSSSSSSNSRNGDSRQNYNNGRVRVAARLRPRNAEELILDADFNDCVELLPELKRLKLKKNNWSSESYRFDKVFTETASQKRVYEAVVKVCTGKTYTVGKLGKDDAAERGIMVRALKDVLASTMPGSDVVEVSYLQLYMESIQDLLAPEKTSIPINEDARTGEVSLPDVSVVKEKLPV
ncbi:hypothetical protein POTOM_029212 [Populus tomentosa]|uniref:Kinesin motor domain-containing protein n=1 Tax=Populus tomentosa TaxID=118781 RepID=A0A8X7Z9M0_POPTO|nr:hypothetical protein POTOM_029212 [Populus tomentosa]